jgi:hypothetical protein
MNACLDRARPRAPVPSRSARRVVAAVIGFVADAFLNPRERARQRIDQFRDALPVLHGAGNHLVGCVEFAPGELRRALERVDERRRPPPRSVGLGRETRLGLS